jgi:hypothetical protein
MERTDKMKGRELKMPQEKVGSHTIFPEKQRILEAASTWMSIKCQSKCPPNRELNVTPQIHSLPMVMEDCPTVFTHGLNCLKLAHPKQGGNRCLQESCTPHPKGIFHSFVSD